MITSGSCKSLFLALLPVLAIFIRQGHAEVTLQKEQTVTTVNDMNGFMQDVFVQGYSDKDDYFPILFNSLEEISEIEFYMGFDNIKWEKLKLKTSELKM